MSTAGSNDEQEKDVSLVAEAGNSDGRWRTSLKAIEEEHDDGAG